MNLESNFVCPVGPGCSKINMDNRLASLAQSIQHQQSLVARLRAIRSKQEALFLEERSPFKYQQVRTFQIAAMKHVLGLNNVHQVGTVQNQQVESATHVKQD
jgi:hypothetical protein